MNYYEFVEDVKLLCEKHRLSLEEVAYSIDSNESHKYPRIAVTKSLITNRILISIKEIE